MSVLFYITISLIFAFGFFLFVKSSKDPIYEDTVYGMVLFVLLWPIGILLTLAYYGGGMLVAATSALAHFIEKKTKK